MTILLEYRPFKKSNSAKIIVMLGMSLVLLNTLIYFMSKNVQEVFSGQKGLAYLGGRLFTFVILLLILIVLQARSNKIVRLTTMGIEIVGKNEKVVFSKSWGEYSSVVRYCSLNKYRYLVLANEKVTELMFLKNTLIMTKELAYNDRAIIIPEPIGQEEEIRKFESIITERMGKDIKEVQP